jgi:cobalamin biosynthesis Co2+ chelatase CbiK
MGLFKTACYIFLLLLPMGSAAQQLSKRLSNQDVMEMVALGLSDSVIVDKIHATEETDFDTGIAALRAFKAAGVSDAVIRAMIVSHLSD